MASFFPAKFFFSSATLILCLCYLHPSAAHRPIRTTVRLDPTGTEFINKVCNYHDPKAPIDYMDCDLFLEDAPQELKGNGAGFTQFALDTAKEMADKVTADAQLAINGKLDIKLKEGLKKYCISDRSQGASLQDNINKAVASLKDKRYADLRAAVKAAQSQVDACYREIGDGSGDLEQAYAQLQQVLFIAPKMVAAFFPV